MLAFNDAMEGLLRGLEASNGDLSDGRQRLREELARVSFDAPRALCTSTGTARQSGTPTWSESVRGGRWAFQLVRVVPGVEQTFGGLLSDVPSPARQPAVPKGDSASLGALAARPNRPGEAGLARARAQASGAEPSPDDQRRVVRRSGERGASVPDPVASPAVG